MARLTASQISLMKQLFTQVGSSIEVDQVNGVDNWFATFFNALGPSLVTSQGTSAVNAAAAAQADATSALSILAARQAGLQRIAANQVLATTVAADITDLSATITVTEPTDFFFRLEANMSMLATCVLWLKLNVSTADPVIQEEHGIFTAPANQRVTCSVTWKLTLAPGTHTVYPWGVTGTANATVEVEGTSFSWWQV